LTSCGKLILGFQGKRMSDVFQAALKNCANMNAPSVTMSGRGIVTCAGGERLFTCVYVLVRILRETLNCTLPMQIWHFGGEELSPVMRWLLKPFDVELVDAASFLADFPSDIRNGWQLKPYAMLHSHFEEVLFLDADQVPVRDPAILFDLPQYLETGAVFWPDVTDLKAENPIWDLLGLTPQACPAWESGQMLLDKRRHTPSLRTALCLNEQAGLVYRMLYGDKDTFLVAWRFTGADAAVVSHRPFADDRVLIQRDFNGAPLFQHRTGSKWSYHVDQYRTEGLVHMEHCLAFLADLRRSWNGRQFFPPDRSYAACAEEERIALVGRTRLIVLGEGEASLELLPGHQIGEGRHVDRQNWFVIETKQGMELMIHDGDRVTYCLRHIQGGAWRGERFSFPVTEVRLDERPAPGSPSPPASTYNGLVDAIVSASGVASGAGAEARERLISTLRLLLCAQPGLRPAIERAAKGSVELIEVIDQVLASNAKNAIEAIAFDADILREGYTAPDGPGL
jgi:hypothetical protein